MATNQTHSSDDHPTHPLHERLRAIPAAAAEGLFAYSVKIVCGKQTGSGETPLTIAILSIVSQLELSVSAVYTASPLSGDGISIDVEYIPSRRLVVGGRG